MQQHSGGHRIDGRGQSNRKTARHDDSCGETWLPAGAPQRSLRVLEYALDDQRTSKVVHRLLGLRHAAHVTQRHSARLDLVQASAHVRLGLHLHMEPQLLVQFVLGAPARQHAPQMTNKRCEHRSPRLALCALEDSLH
jgi:hypothetical protein